VNPGGAGDLVITVGGDLSPLEAALNQIPSTASQVASQVQAAFDSIPAAIEAVGSSAVTASEQLSQFGTSTEDIAKNLESLQSGITSSGDEMTTLADAANTAGDAATGAADQVDQLDKALQPVASSAQEAATAIQDVGHSSEEAAPEVENFWEKMLAFGEALALTEGLKEFGQEALSTFGNVQKAAVSLTALTGSAEEADKILEQLKTLAVADALSFPALVQAETRMRAFNISAEQIPKLLQAAADASATMGTDFNHTVDILDRFSSSGAVVGRSLAQLGMSSADLAKVMDVSTSEVTKAFKALDQTERVDVLTQALAKFGGVASEQAQTISGQFKNLGTQVEFVMESIGAALAPVISAVLTFIGTNIVPTIQAAVDAFNKLPGPVKDVAVALGLIVALAAPLVVALGGFGLAATAAADAIPMIAAFGASISTLVTVTLPGFVASIGTVVEAVGTGMTGALVGAETAILGFLTAAAGIAAVVVLWDQVKELIKNLTDLNQVLSDGVPAWNSFKDSLSSLAQLIGGAVASAFNSLLGMLGPVGDAIKSLGAYLPNFTQLWQQVKDAVSSIHWSDLLGPIGALNGALKALADAIQLITGHYPSMEAAGTKALASIQSANDKLNDSLARQAGGFTALTPAQTAYTNAQEAAAKASATAADAATKAGAAAEGSVKPHMDAAKAVADHATASDSLYISDKKYMDYLSTMGQSIQVIAGAHRNAAEAANEDSLSIEVLTGSIAKVNDQADQSGKVFSDAADGMMTWSNADQAFVNSSGAVVDSIHAIADAANQVTTSANAAASAVSGIGRGGGGGRGGKMGLGGTEGAGISADLAAAMGGQSAPMTLSVQPGDVIQAPTMAGALGGFFGALHNDITLDPMQAAINTWNKIQQENAMANTNPVTGQPFNQSAASTAVVATAATTVANALTKALQDAQTANALEAAAQAAVGTAAYAKLKAVADQAVAAAGQELDAAMGVTNAMNSTTVATTAAAGSVAMLANNAGVVSSTLAVASQGVAALATATQTAAAQIALAGQGVIASMPLQTGGYTPATLGPGGGVISAAALGVPNQPTVSGQVQNITLHVNLTGSTIVGQQAMANLSDQMAQSMVAKLTQIGIRTTRL